MHLPGANAQRNMRDRGSAQSGDVAQFMLLDDGRRLSRYRKKTASRQSDSAFRRISYIIGVTPAPIAISGDERGKQ